MAKPTGIRTRHSRTCGSLGGRTCNCTPSYEASVYDRRSGTKIRKSFRNHAEAKGWRADATSAVQKGAMRAPTRRTVREAWDEWLSGARGGGIRTRGGDVFKSSVIRSYETSMTLRVLPDFGGARLTELTRLDVQDLADRMLAAELDPSTIRNTLMPLRASRPKRRRYSSRLHPSRIARCGHARSTAAFVAVS